MKKIKFIPKHVFLCIFFLSFINCNKELKNVESVTLSQSLIKDRSNKLNIILIMADDIGREIPTYNGGESYNTPNLDFLAENGINFSHFYAHPDGPPSRLALVTGRYNVRNWIGFGELPATEKTFGNLLQEAGYATSFVGKWQFDGGDTSIVNHGFKDYLVFMPYEKQKNNGHDQYYRRYKNPYLYTQSHYLSDTQVSGKYSEDLFYDHIAKFIDSNLINPFLIVYSLNLAQRPLVPTPDNPGFLAWDPAVDDEAKESISYFPEMVKYMDKNVGKVISKIQSAGLTDKTIIIFTSDNATNKHISSVFKGKAVNGTKNSTTAYGTNVPFLVYAPGVINKPGTIDTSLVDMTDIFPTFANVAGVGTQIWQPLDGTTFFDNLLGEGISKQRSYVYCYWPQYFRTEPPLSYVFDYNYKLYDSANGSKFYNIKADPDEIHPLLRNELTSDEKAIKSKFVRILKRFDSTK